MNTVDNWDTLPNINVKHCYKDDNTLSHYSLFPAENYILHAPHLDEPVLDDMGNETGEIRPYYTLGGATEFANYDFVANPKGWNAIPTHKEA